MPTKPGFDGNNGYIRTIDLIEAMHKDVLLAYKALENDKSSQYLRRCVVRSVFSFIEACIEALKVEVRSSLRSGASEVGLSDKDFELLGSTDLVRRREDKHIPLDTNLKCTFRLAAKAWSIDNYIFPTDGGEYAELIRAKSARNRLTHPRTFHDIQVTDRDMCSHTTAYSLVLREFSRIFRLRAVTMAAQMPPDVASAFLQHIAEHAPVRDD